MSTLADIAKLADTSISTVSRALKKDPRISREMQEKIERIAEEEGYTKHRSKMPAALQDWGLIGLIVPEVLSGYYARIVHLAHQMFAENRFTTTVRLTEFSSQMLLRHLYDLNRSRVDGLLIVMDDAEIVSEEIRNAISYIQRPALFITTHYIANMDYDSIFLDELRGITMGVEHLAARGYKRIGFLGEAETEGRLAYFREAMAKCRLPIREETVLMSSLRAEAGGYESMKRLLTLPPPLPDAVFASYDQMAIGAIRALREAGLGIPEDMAVLGFDDLTVAPYIDKGLTTIKSPSEDMISISCRILLHRIQMHDQSTPQQIALKPQLIVRGTT